MLTSTKNIQPNKSMFSQTAKDASISNVNFQKVYNSLLLKLVLPITVFSVSWFITDDFGNMQKNGVAQIENLEIDVSTLPKGAYSIRLMGEVHSFQLS